MDFKDFVKGSDEYRPLPLWSLNHELSHEEMTRQIDEMAAKGVQGFILHARSGLMTPYLSERWFGALEHAILEARRLGLKAWLYDEDPYPSGIAGGRVTADHPEYRAQTLGVTRGRVKGPGLFTMDIPMKRLEYAVAARLEGSAIAETVDLSPYIGSMRTRWQERRHYHTYYPTTDSKASPQFRADTEDPFYRLEWEAPEGDWRVFAFASSPVGKYWLFDSFADLLNPDAVAYFMETTYLPYEKKFGKYFGSVVPGIFIDEPKFISSPYPWTGRLPEEFMERKSYPIIEALLALELETEGGAQKRRDFWDAVGGLFNESYVLQLRRWCDRNGLKLIGHNSPEEEPGDQVFITGDLMKFLRHMDYPGTDLITFQIGDRRHPIVNLGPKLAASVSRQWRGGRALCEAYAVMEWQLDLAGMAWVAGWLFALGVNTVAPHTFIYSIDGPRKRDAAPSVFYQVPYWEHFRAYSDHLARLGYMLGDTDPCADTALVYPFDSFESLQMLQNARCCALRDRFVWLFDALLRSHVQFELVDIDDLTAAPVEASCLTVGNRTYRRVILPEVAYVSGALEAALDRLCAHDICVSAPSGAGMAYLESLGAEMPIEDIPAFRKASFRYTLSGSPGEGFAADGLEKVLEACADSVELSGQYASEILLNHSIKDGRDIYYLFNPTEKAVALSVRLRCGQSMELEQWDARADAPVSAREGAPGVWSAAVPPRGSVILVSLERNARVQHCLPSMRNEPDKTVEISLPGVWRATPGRRNALILDRWVLDQSKDSCPGEIDFRRGLPVVQPGALGAITGTHYPDTIWYKSVVNLSGIPRRMALVTEKSAISGAYALFCNGLPCGDGVHTREYDCNNIEFTLTERQLTVKSDHFYQKDEVVIALRVTVCGPEDGLLEPLRLFGDFRASLNQGESIGATLAAAEFPLSLSAGSWADQGYPHYSGAMLYEQDVEIPAELAGRSARLRFSAGTCSAEVLVNGMSAGIVAWEPYEAVVTGMLREGMNRIGIRVANTLEPLLYGTGKPAGIFGPASLLFGRG